MKVHSEYDFTVGDRVESVIDRNERNPGIMKGSTGTIIVIRSKSPCTHIPIGVRWDDQIPYGHGLGLPGECNCYWVNERSIALISDIVEADSIPDISELLR